MDRTPRKETDSVAIPIIITDFDRKQKWSVVASISNPDFPNPTSSLQSSV